MLGRNKFKQSKKMYKQRDMIHFLLAIGKTHNAKCLRSLYVMFTRFSIAHFKNRIVFAMCDRTTIEAMKSKVKKWTMRTKQIYCQ